MSYLQFLSRDFVAQHYRATKSQVRHAVSHTASLSHKRELTNQRSPHFRDEVTQNRARALIGKGVARLFKSYATRHVTLAILSRDKKKLRDKIAQ